MKWKNDWPAAQERLAALWEGEYLERPCMTVMAPSGRSVHWPPPPATPEQQWLDPAWVVPRALAQMESTWWGGEAVPSFLLMAGWIVCFGARPQFNANTIWLEPGDVSLDAPPAFRYDPEDPWVRRHEQLYLALAAAAGPDDFLVGNACILPANDLLAAILGPDRLLMAMAEQPEWVDAALRQLTAGIGAARRRLRGLIAGKHEFWYGIGGWMPLWLPGYFLSTQSDVSCMISPAMYQRFVLPELEALAQEGAVVWYHLDGSDAKQHLPRLLSLPWLRFIQYVPRPCEPPNGPGHLAMYRQIQEAGKTVHVQVAKEHVEPLIKALDPRRLILQVGVGSPAEGEELLAAAKRWTGGK